MENEDLLTEIVNQSNEIHKGFMRMRAKYSLSDIPLGSLVEKFLEDAKEFMHWRKIGVE